MKISASGLSAQAVSAFWNTGAVPRGLPAPAYTSQAFFARECETVFFDHWVFAAFAHELATAGDVCPIQVAGRPVLLVRGGDGELRAFENVCRHRCLQLVTAAGNAGQTLRCPYHAWTYGLDGTLMITPFFGGSQPREVPPGFDRRDHGLKALRCAEWHDWVFVNLSGRAQSFESFIAPIGAWISDMNVDALVALPALDFDNVQCNWKFLIENFIEPYHVPVVHAKTTEQPLANHYVIDNGPCLGCAIDVEAMEVRDGHHDDGAHPSAPVRDGALAASSRYLTLFPNFVLARYLPNQLGVHLNTPLAPGTTAQRRVIYVPHDIAANAAEMAALRSLWQKVHREDHAMCERLQSGRTADVAQQGGVISPVWEPAVRRFQERILATMGAGRHER
ncbi:MAG: Rieske 2Fe-2S domain-containing protein [Gammaproteobacteria bacterium]|nr:Rieske 2Fe-2S domain-containing protein [Gammaproteobacteria bacterium]